MEKLQIVTDFQEFMFKNNILISAAGFTVGAATKEVIEHTMEKAIFPMMSFVWIKVSTLLKINNFKRLSAVFDYIGDIVTWLITLLFAFFFLEYFFARSIIGVKSKLDHQEKRKFENAKVQGTDNRDSSPMLILE